MPVRMQPKRPYPAPRKPNRIRHTAVSCLKLYAAPFLVDVLLRTVASASQTTKSRVERYDNVEKVFSLSVNHIELADKHILVVDDVLTTGATICAAGNLLKDIGAQISVATLARA